MSSPHTLFVGIGSPHGDDRIGWMLADALRERSLAGVEVRQASTPSHLLDWLGPFERLVVADAYLADADSDAHDRSRLQRWNWPTNLVSILRSANSHAFGLPQVLQLAERLGSLPEDVVVYGLAGSNFSAFAELSRELAADFDELSDTIADEAGAVRHA